MPTFRTTGQLDDPYIEDGDTAFKGLDQQTQPLLLEAGMVSVAENVRFNNGVITQRGGIHSVLAIGSSFQHSPRGQRLVRWSDPNSEIDDLLVLDFDEFTGITSDINQNLATELPINRAMHSIQAFGQLIIFCDGLTPQTWDASYVTIVNSDGSHSQMHALVQEMSRTPADSAVNFVCPPVGFGVYLSNRLVVPYYEDSSTTIAFSDILEHNQFTFANTFYCNKGTSDKSLAICPYAENQAIIFNERSIHIINNTHSLGVNSTNFEITRQYGIAGSRAYAQSGNYTYFISNEGDIQVIVPSSDPAKGMGIAISKATVESQPLSKPIQKTMDMVDLRSLPNSIVHYHRNKVYFIFGVDSEKCNTIAVYDSLMSIWVSIDTFAWDIEIRDMNSLGKDLYILTDGGLGIYEKGNNDRGSRIYSKIKTRSYDLGSREVKKFVRGSLSYEADRGMNIKVTTETKNPDSSIVSKETLLDADESTLSRFNVSQRGHNSCVQVEFGLLHEMTGEQYPLAEKVQLDSISLEAFASSRTTGDFT